MRLCLRCDAPVHRAGSAGPWPSYCTQSCRRRANYERTRQDGRYDQALAERKRQTKTRAETRPVRTCRYCPRPVTGNRLAIRCSSAECKRTFDRDRNLEHQRTARAEYAARGESYRARWERKSYGAGRRRAAMFNVTADPIDVVTLGHRDGWMCGLCRKPVNRAIKWPDRFSPSVDHVLPFNHGGQHVWANVQIAHLTCNAAKKDRIDWTPEAA